jgi:hypothetical protein
VAEPLALWSVVAAALGGAALSLGIEGLLRPASLPFWRRPLAALALHLGLWLLLFACLLLVLRRPFFAAGALLAGLLFLVLVSNAKYHSLREPFIFQDFEYFSDALKHPRLYLPFLGAGRAAAGAPLSGWRHRCRPGSSSRRCWRASRSPIS